MRYVIDKVRNKENHEMLSVIRLEIDYELVTLMDAMEAEDTLLIENTKNKLTTLVQKMNTFSSSPK